ncbi:chaperonin 10-like protein [Fusarium avenaceum]|nr:chaperonin 10-like protein [Fusarium avenaceum]
MYLQAVYKIIKAALWKGIKSIELGDIPKPTITAPNNAIIHITHYTIYGSDLYIYNSDLNRVIEKGLIIGRKAIGIVKEVGPLIKNIKLGDRVIILPIIAYGDYFYCKRKEYSLYDRTNPSKKLDYSLITGGYTGDQAEYCRVPNADLTYVKAPRDIAATKLVGLANVTPTAWHGYKLADIGKGDIVGVWGYSAVGLSIQCFAKLRGARRVYAIDKDANRLDITESFGIIPININNHPAPADYILSIKPHGLDRAIEASGFRSTRSATHTAIRALGVKGDSSDAIYSAIKATRKGGTIALIGDFFYTTNNFPIEMLIEKAITLRRGRLYAQKSYSDFFSHKLPGGLKLSC